MKIFLIVFYMTLCCVCRAFEVEVTQDKIMAAIQKKVATTNSAGGNPRHASFERRSMGGKGYLKARVPRGSDANDEVVMEFDAKTKGIVVWMPQRTEMLFSMMTSLLFETVVAGGTEDISISFKFVSKIPDPSKS